MDFMKYSLRLLCAVTLVFAMSAADLQAAGLSKTEAQAFTAADKKNWPEALNAAAASGNAALRDLITWQYVMEPNSGVTFDEAVEFIRTHLHWPEQRKLILRAEETLKDRLPEPKRLKAWFNQNPPITGFGKWLEAEMIIGSHPTAEQMKQVHWQLRDAWRNGDYDEQREAQLLTRHGHLFKTSDHRQRIDRLLWQGRIQAAERVMPLISEGAQALYKARIAYIENDKNKEEALAAVPKKFRHDSGLLYELLRDATRREDDATARRILLNVSGKVPYEEKWWRYREIQVRHAIDEGDYELAEKLLENHTQVDGAEFAEAAWLSGWLALRFMHKPEKALKSFVELYDNVRYPVSVSRAAYWAGRASEELGEPEKARRWYQRAARHSTYFYGQLAREKLGEAIPLPATPQIASGTRQQFFKNELVKAALLAIAAEEKSTANLFINHLIENAGSKEEIILAAEIGHKAGRMYYSVRAAKRAFQYGETLIDAAFPTPPLKGDMGVEMPLILAIARQESEFDPNARSSANALGLTQLLYATARETARRNDVPFVRRRLTEMSYNAQLGSHYLARLIRIFDGSYIMAIGAYNAGPGRMRQWEDRFGTPGNNLETAIDWIERIPYSETRNYIQRVMENHQVYRALLAVRKGQSAPLKLAENITR